MLQTQKPLKRAPRIPAQTSVIWIASKQGYLARFSRDEVVTVSNADEALHLNEDRASSTALNLRMMTGLIAAVRPFYQFR